MLKSINNLTITKEYDSFLESNSIKLEGTYKNEWYKIEIVSTTLLNEHYHVFHNFTDKNGDGIEFSSLDNFKSELEWTIEHNESEEEYYTLEKMAFVTAIVKAFLNKEI